MVKLSLATIQVGRFEVSFVGEIFELEIWHTCYQYIYNFMKKYLWKKKKISILGKMAKLASLKVGKLLISFFG